MRFLPVVSLALAWFVLTSIPLTWNALIAACRAEETASFVYKPSPRRTLTVHYPDDWQPADQRTALVIFRCRIPEQREHFRKLGMVIIKPQLAAVNSGKLPGMSLAAIAKSPKPRQQVADAKSVIRYLRSNAGKFGISPDRIVATGTSGGGDLALQSFLNKSFNDAQDDQTIDHRPNALVLYCPAFDGIDIWFVKSQELLKRTKSEAPSFLPLLPYFAKGLDGQYATPNDHRAALIKLAGELGVKSAIPQTEIDRFRKILEMFNARDWQLLHPVEEALKMSASRILTKEPLPPTLIMFGTRDHLVEHQQAFVRKARAMGQKFELTIFEGGGHSFMTQPAFQAPSTQRVQTFLEAVKLLPAKQ